MKSKWRIQLIATVVYLLAAGAVGWTDREALYYLDAGAIFACIAAIPPLLLLGYYLWDKSHPGAGEHWKICLGIIFTIFASLATACLLLAALVLPVVGWMTPINNVRKYDYIAGKWSSPFTAHFPRPLPRDVQAVRFYFEPGAMQAPTVFELGYSTTPERIDALYREYARRSTLTFAAGTENGIIEPSNCLANDAQEFVDFSSDYTLFFLDEKPPTEEKDWNHPSSHGVAISKKRCRIIFWAWDG